VNPYQWLVEVCEPPFLLEPLAVAQFSLSRFRPDGDRDDASERQGRRVDTALVLKSVEALADPSDVRALQGRARSDRLLHDGVDMVEQLDAGGSMDALELSLGVLSAAGEFRVFVEPALAEPGLAFEFSDVSLGSGDLAIEVLGDGLGVGSPLLFGESLGSDGRPVDATPAIPLPSSYDRSVHQEVGVLTLAAGLVELAGSAACEGVLPAAGAAGEVLAISAQSVEIPACRTALRQAHDRHRHARRAPQPIRHARRAPQRSQRRRRRRRPDPTHHRPAPTATPLAHLGPGQGNGSPRPLQRRHRCPRLLLRPPQPVATRLQREHQRTAAPVLPQTPRPRPPSPNTTSTPSPPNSTDALDKPSAG
jgi:hypothetical protein